VVGDWLSLPALTGCISAGAAAAATAPSAVLWNIPGGGKQGIQMTFTLQGGASGLANIDWPTDGSNTTYSFNGDGGQVLQTGTPIFFAGELVAVGGDAPTSYSWQFTGQSGMDAVEYLPPAQDARVISGQNLTAASGDMSFIIHDWEPGDPVFLMVGSASNSGGTASSAGTLTLTE
tara:strand:- start:621 stop:1148 length:528 start_codon:yes stop_codon:yes gene_type:complete